jgi:hypothetical protein
VASSSKLRKRVTRIGASCHKQRGKKTATALKMLQRGVKFDQKTD